MCFWRFHYTRGVSGLIFIIKLTDQNKGGGVYHDTKERAVAALNLQTPDKVPTFELEFQLEEEMFGRKFITEDLEPEKLVKLSLKEKEAVVRISGIYGSCIRDS